MLLSAVVLAKNEEKNIAVCLDALTFCDEIIVIDDHSIDKTQEIAKQKNARVLVRPLKNDFSQQRNFGLHTAKGEWILFIDADEYVTQSLQQEIKRVIASNPKSVFQLRRIDTMWGKKLLHGECGNIRLTRLIKRNSGEWSGAVHEEFVTLYKKEQLQYALLHFPHPSITAFLSEINYYTTLRAQELFAQGTKVSSFDIILYPKSKFILNYFGKLGFLDGMPGLIFAIFMSFHSFLVRGKLWLLWQKK